MEVDRIEIKARASTRAKRRTRAKAGGTIVLWALVAMAEDVEKAKAVATKDEKKVSRKARANPRARASARKARKARTRARWVHNSAEIAWSTASRAENVPTEMCSRWPTRHCNILLNMDNSNKEGRLVVVDKDKPLLHHNQAILSLGIPSLSSASHASVRMVATGPTIAEDVVI